MAINLQAPDIRELKPHITVFGVGGAGGNAVNNMIESGLKGVEFVVANTDAQALTSSKAERIIQMGLQVTEGLGAGSQPEVGRAAAEEVIDEIRDQLSGSHMVFITAGMGGGTGTGAAPVVARAAREMGILTVGVVTKPFQFEGVRRMRLAESGIGELQQSVDTLIVIPNQNLFRVATEKTTFADAFAMADQVLYSGVACITDLMVKEGLINLDFADVRAVMRGMGKAMMGTGEASGEKRAMRAAEAAIANPLLDDVSMRGARGLLISITGGNDLTLYEVDEAATRIREEVDQDANIILGATFDESLEGIVRVSVVATGIDQEVSASHPDLTSTEQRISEVAERLRAEARARATARPGGPDLSRQPPRAGGEACARRSRGARRSGRDAASGDAASADAARDARRRGAHAGSAEAGRRLRAPAAASRLPGRTAAGRLLHPAAGRAGRGARGAHAAGRGTAGAGAEPDPCQPRRAGAVARPEANDAAAASRDGRLRPPRGGPGAPARPGASSCPSGTADAGAAPGPRGAPPAVTRSTPNTPSARCRHRATARHKVNSTRTAERPRPGPSEEDQLEIPAFLRRPPRAERPYGNVRGPVRREAERPCGQARSPMNGQACMT